MGHRLSIALREGLIAMHVRCLCLSASPKRATIEASLLAIVLWASFLLLYSFFPSWADIRFVYLVGPLSMCVFILRLRKTESFWFKRSVLDALFGLALALGLTCIEAIITAIFSSRLPATRFTPHSYAIVLAFGFPLNCAIGFFGRITLRCLLIWNNLRRKHLLWQLTNAHVMMLALVAGVIIVFIDVVLLIGMQSYRLPMILPITFVLIIFSAIVMVIVVSPIALFSHFVVRRVIERIKLLTRATSALRAGNYAVRVPVNGEDEVAQLQSDFNAMAMDLERAMHALQQERDRVAALLQERRELIANVSHELRTPVATLRGYLETTLMHWDETTHAALHRDLQVMEDEVLHLQGRVEDLFTLARADVGRLTLQKEPTDVGELVYHVVDTRAPLAWSSSRIEIVAEVPPELPLALADARRLEQALQNLLHNGLRHTSPGGIVAVVVQVEATTVSIHVKDTGEGIAPADLPHIWQRFYQTESARTRMGGGTGLGLALVKEWIEGMGGTVSVSSQPGEGSCFTLCLPLLNVIDSGTINHI
jgi:signal transduction histidine kinase